MDPEKLMKMMNDLKKIMNEDGKITNEEKSIFDKVTSDVSVFEKAYNRAMEDKVITEEEYLELIDLWNRIYDESYKEAMKDNHLSDDEAKMVFSIFEKMNS